jgi:hypothetical protein
VDKLLEKERLKKIIGQKIERDLELNGLSIDIVNDITLRRHFIIVDDLT